MGFTLPITDAKGAKNVKNLFTDFNLCAITNELGGSATIADVILQGMDKLTVSFNAVDIRDLGIETSKDNRCGRTIIDSRNIRINDVTCDRFVATGDIERRIGRLERAFQQGTRRKACILSGTLEGVLDNIRR